MEKKQPWKNERELFKSIFYNHFKVYEYYDSTSNTVKIDSKFYDALNKYFLIDDFLNLFVKKLNMITKRYDIDSQFRLVLASFAIEYISNRIRKANYSPQINGAGTIEEQLVNGLNEAFSDNKLSKNLYGDGKKIRSLKSAWYYRIDESFKPIMFIMNVATKRYKTAERQKKSLELQIRKDLDMKEEYEKLKNFHEQMGGKKLKDKTKEMYKKILLLQKEFGIKYGSRAHAASLYNAVRVYSQNQKLYWEEKKIKSTTETIRQSLKKGILEVPE